MQLHLKFILNRLVNYEYSTLLVQLPRNQIFEDPEGVERILLKMNDLA
jgi:hypothetical protein